MSNALEPLTKNPLMLSATDLDTNVAVRQGIFSCLKIKQAKLRLVPAAVSVLVQMSAFATVLLSVLAIHYIIQFQFSIFSIVLMQAIIASGLSMLVGMARWWRWIHFCFPLALWGMSMWQVPNELYMIGFLMTLSLYWTTFRSQVPFYPSRPNVWRKVSELVPEDKAIRMIDIGSGLGDLSMHLAKSKPNSQIEGIEIAPLPWFISKLRAIFKGSSATFKLGDYNQLSFADYDVVFAYLSPAAMPALWQKAQQEMQAGSMLISYEFDIPGANASLCIKGEKQSSNLYVWKL
jgi:hypothetical protein